MEIIEAFRELATSRYFINNLITQRSKFIFILESPHTAEVANDCPVAGSSGKSMTKALFNGSLTEPLGLLTQKAIQGESIHEALNTFGIMNVCQIPLQKAAYSQQDQVKYRDLLESLEAIRVKYGTAKYKDDRQTLARQLVTEALSNTLIALKPLNPILIPCGKFAESYLKRALQGWSSGWNIHTVVPHPSYNQWMRQKKVIDTLKAEMGIK